MVRMPRAVKPRRHKRSGQAASRINRGPGPSPSILQGVCCAGSRVLMGGASIDASTRDLIRRCIRRIKWDHLDCSCRLESAIERNLCHREQFRHLASANLLVSIMRDARTTARLRTGAFPPRTYSEVPVPFHFIPCLGFHRCIRGALC